MKKDDVELLGTVYGTVTMGAGAVEHLLSVVKDDSLRDELTEQLGHYRAIEAATLGRLHRLHEAPEDYGVMSKLMSRVGIKLNTALDASSSHLAEMVIQGSAMGLTELEGARNSCPNASDEAKHLCSSLIEFEQRCTERMKKYLR